MADSNAGSNPRRDEGTADRSNGGGVPAQIPRAAGRYIRGVTLGQGTYGVVYKAIDTLTNRTVAVKKIRLGAVKEGVNVTALREIKLLKELKDPNIIELIDAYPHKKNLYLVFEFMESDLETVIKDRNIVLSPADIKSYMQMTLKGLAYCHKKWVLHRDMKPNNLLIASDGQLKLGDFGLARIFGSPDRIFTYQVFARWYRAPELLYSAKYYGPAVDIWAAGCIFAELLLRRPLLQGTSDLDQLGKIFSIFGTPRASQWPDMTTLPDYIEYNFVPAQPLRSLFPMASEDALDLLSKMFTYDPKARISAQQALEHRYFSSVPAPTRPELLPKPPSRPEAANPAKAQEPVSSEDRDVVSPSTKARRVMLFPGDPAAGDVHSSRKPGKQATEAGTGSRGEIGTAGGNCMSGVEVHPDMSLDKLIANGVAIPPRPRLTDSAKSYLKRKYNLQAAFEQIAQEQETKPDLDSDRHSHKKERHS